MLEQSENQNYTVMHLYIYSSVTDAIHSYSLVEDLTCDWLNTQTFQAYLSCSWFCESDCNLAFLCKIHVVSPVF